MTLTFEPPPTKDNFMLKPLIRTLKSPFREKAKLHRREKKFNKRLKMLDQQARETALKTKDFTLLNPEKLYAFIQAVRYIQSYSIPGDIVECGVWRGGAIMAAAFTLNQLGSSDRKFYLYDTFAGMTQPTDKDIPMPGTGDIDVPQTFIKTQTSADSSDWCCAGLADVKANLAKVPYDQDKFIFVEGKVEDTLPNIQPDTISILRLDTDWYESTKVEMEHLMPLLAPKGVLIIDDYYRWKGNKDAVDEYLAQQKIPILLTRVANSAIGVKPE